MDLPSPGLVDIGHSSGTNPDPSGTVPTDADVIPQSVPMAAKESARNGSLDIDSRCVIWNTCGSR